MAPPFSADDGMPIIGTEAPASFAKLMALQQMSTDEAVRTDGKSAPTEKVVKFYSLSKPFSPGLAGRAFGGHVYAQAAYAASKTVGAGFRLHNITGSFTLPGRTDTPFTYYVRCVRDGGMYCLRSVDVRQAGALCFTCICSFKRAERDNPYTHQKKVDISQKYHSVLHRKKIEDHPPAPEADMRWWVEAVKSGEFEEEAFPGVEVRKVDMGKYNDTEKVRENPDLYRQLQYYRLLGTPDGGDDDRLSEEEKEKDARGEYDNLYASAHLYASDKNSLFVINTALDMEDRFFQMASLSHTVVFHTFGEALKMIDWGATGGGGQGVKKWFVQEASTSRSGENRGLHESRIWSPDGTLLATTMQDGMIRVKEKEREGKL